MRIVEFVAFVLAGIALFGWMVGRPHTLAASGRAPGATRVDARGDTFDGVPDSSMSAPSASTADAARPCCPTDGDHGPCSTAMDHVASSTPDSGASHD